MTPSSAARGQALRGMCGCGECSSCFVVFGTLRRFTMPFFWEMMINDSPSAPCRKAWDVWIHNRLSVCLIPSSMCVCVCVLHGKGGCCLLLNLTPRAVPWIFYPCNSSFCPPEAVLLCAGCWSPLGALAVMAHVSLMASMGTSFVVCMQMLGMLQPRSRHVTRAQVHGVLCSLACACMAVF